MGSHMSVTLLMISSTLFTFGFIGCFVNKVPGPLLAFLGALIPVIAVPIKVALWKIILIFALVVASMVVAKKYLPKLGEMVHPFGKGGSWGTTVGTIFGYIMMLGFMEGTSSKTGIIFLMILPLTVFPYLFAFAFEYISRKNVAEAAQSGVGAYVTYLASSVLKLLVFCMSIDIVFDIF